MAVGLSVLLGLALFTGSHWGEGSWPRLPIETIGLVLIVIAIVGRGWCSLYIGGRKATELVTTGPYSISRNPLYGFSFMGSLGVGLQSGSLLLGLVFLLAAMAIFLPLIAREESFLDYAMPRRFDAYRRATPLLWPRPSLWRTPEELTVRPSLFLRTLSDGLPFILAWPLFGGIDALQSGGLLPVLLRWP
ncbi:hypothetical protein BZG35_13145 [Brevundimonas sp. LM2]|nr:hypothetical protein BZG35_13145 [Brevundimonas sp. LM2]